MRGPESILAFENSSPGIIWVKKSQVNTAKIFSYKQSYDQLLIPKDRYRNIHCSFT